MSEFEKLHVSAPLAAALEALGVHPADPSMREAVPTAARGHNLVVISPPAACYASAALAGMLSHFTAGGSRAVLLCPDPALDEWASVLAPLALAAGLGLEVARTPTRATRRLRAGAADLLLTTPDTALSLVRRSALKMEAVTHLALCWPEFYEDQEALAPLMQDLSKDAQRIVFTSRAEISADLAERYARRALVAGEAPSTPVPGSARVVTVPWRNRASAVASLLELLDPASATIWTRDRGGVELLSRTLLPGDATVRVETGDATPADLLIACDLPTPSRLRQLIEAGPVVLLAPGYAQDYTRRLIEQRQPLRLPGLLEVADRESAVRRATIVRALEEKPPTAAVLALAPLFERFDPTAVAAALYDLWTSQVAATAPVASPEVPATAKLWVGIGKKDGATANDLMAALTREARIDRKAIGRIEVRELYCLVELPAQDVERAAALVNGLAIRKRRVSARVDRGGKPR